ncbi:hypothetical protein EDC91_11575 [Shewanella fodinae]|jgi:hypothetical protein|uniref:HicA-like toxin of HicAB toxin-antitoxin system n=1 Tax=Shewanella fodinae TaxID=552357 RepID=A0A4R2FC14_9GAMM|nr:hypothetical protein EDC91_11575 [Shewanella fodinae]
MKKYSNCKEINLLVIEIIRSDEWNVRKGKHYVLITPCGARLAVPSTPSDRRRAYQNFRKDLRRLQGL